MSEKSELSDDTKTIITVLMLVLAYPIGFILMVVWMKWPGWVKFLVGLPIILMVLAIMGIIGVIVLTIANPSARLKEASWIKICSQSCAVAEDKETCWENCLTPSRGLKVTVSPGMEL
ncbi:hypothetical protein A3K55_02155 [Candidatus Shapirobacteria bacterium RBG_13_44_7]|uniref:Uncharacterized protein n=1 Tax=Candidatus Shapirobacteria bacterium RBG_13_44_7 TaxID=1802149 RepID=A0A1F7SI28_9BACT|nr:MAG: hypothetical protein A3K55_02155 [Candidatus Shapirobacteria bacterium RBG_13_44_7]